MNSGKNPSMKISTLCLTLSLTLFASTGCSTFLRSSSDAENAAENDGKNTYSANETGASTDLKDQKISHLESTVTTLNSRIQELEGKLQAVRTRPDPSEFSESPQQTLKRQSSDAANAVSKIRASVASSDPSAGFVNDASVRAFQQGKLLFDQEKFPEAILAFSAFLETNPNHALASSAQYYIGESYYGQGDYAVADEEFQKLTRRFPHSPRVSYALVRLSQSTAALGKMDESKRYRTQVEGLFPKSPAMKLFNEAPPAGAIAGDAANTLTPIATAPDLTIEKPTVPTVEIPTMERPEVGAPNSDLDAPPGDRG
jgi:tol-pal system protein YbgF